MKASQKQRGDGAVPTATSRSAAINSSSSISNFHSIAPQPPQQQNPGMGRSMSTSWKDGVPVSLTANANSAAAGIGISTDSSSHGGVAIGQYASTSASIQTPATPVTGTMTRMITTAPLSGKAGLNSNVSSHASQLNLLGNIAMTTNSSSTDSNGDSGQLRSNNNNSTSNAPEIPKSILPSALSLAAIKLTSNPLARNMSEIFSPKVDSSTPKSAKESSAARSGSLRKVSSHNSVRIGIGLEPKSPTEKARMSEQVLTEFVYADKGAFQEVYVLGDWNNWDRIPLMREASGYFSGVTAVPLGYHEFLYEIDGVKCVSSKHPVTPDGTCNWRKIYGPKQTRPDGYAKQFYDLIMEMVKVTLRPSRIDGSDYADELGMGSFGASTPGISNFASAFGNGSLGAITPTTPGAPSSGSYSARVESRQRKVVYPLRYFIIAVILYLIIYYILLLFL